MCWRGHPVYDCPVRLSSNLAAIQECLSNCISSRVWDTDVPYVGGGCVAMLSSSLAQKVKSSFLFSLLGFSSTDRVPFLLAPVQSPGDRQPIRDHQTQPCVYQQHKSKPFSLCLHFFKVQVYCLLIGTLQRVYTVTHCLHCVCCALLIISTYGFNKIPNLNVELLRPRRKKKISPPIFCIKCALK